MSAKNDEKKNRPGHSVKILRDYILILTGAFIMAAGMGIFLVDAKVVPGGVSGLSMTIHYLSGNKIPVGLMMWLLNIPLYIWGVRELGKQFGLRTFVGFTGSAFFVDLVRAAFRAWDSSVCTFIPPLYLFVRMIFFSWCWWAVFSWASDSVLYSSSAGVRRVPMWWRLWRGSGGVSSPGTRSWSWIFV